MVDGKIGIVQLLPYFDVTQVDDMELGPVVKELVECLADVVHAISAAFVIDRTTFFLDTDDGQIHAFEVRESVLIAENVHSLAQGLLARTLTFSETLFGYRLKENADVHFVWLMAYDYGQWPMSVSPKAWIRTLGRNEP